MSTRSTIFVLDEDGELLLEMYKQSDGYPGEYGTGDMLARLLVGREIVDAYTDDMTKEYKSVGMGDLAAQIAMRFKEGSPFVGGVYILPHPDIPKERKSCIPRKRSDDMPAVSPLEKFLAETGEEYSYIISELNNRLRIAVFKNGSPIFAGTPEAFAKEFGLADYLADYADSTVMQKEITPGM